MGLNQGPATVIVPFVHGMLNPGTYRAVQYSGYHCKFVDLDPGDEGAYGRLLRQLWRSQCSVIIVEQDVIPTEHQLAVLQWCGHDWCSYRYSGDLYPRGPMFGCVRLSGALMARSPDLAEDRLIIGKRKDQEAPWWNIDTRMAQGLQIRGEIWFEHEPAVVHAHVGPPSGPA